MKDRRYNPDYSRAGLYPHAAQGMCSKLSLSLVLKSSHSRRSIDIFSTGRCVRLYRLENVRATPLGLGLSTGLLRHIYQSQAWYSSCLFLTPKRALKRKCQVFHRGFWVFSSLGCIIKKWTYWRNTSVYFPISPSAGSGTHSDLASHVPITIATSQYLDAVASLPSFSCTQTQLSSLPHMSRQDMLMFEASHQGHSSPTSPWLGAGAMLGTSSKSDETSVPFLRS